MSIDTLSRALAGHRPSATILLAAIVIVSFATAARADTVAGGLAQLPAVTPDQVGAGSLLLRPQVPEEAELPPYRLAPLVATDVEIGVGGLVARATVRQHFHNPGEDWVEGLYVFPLPESAAVDHLRMRVGARVIEGVIHERDEARRIYEEARSEGRKASLLESERPNVFTTSIANIGPGESVVVEIEYQQVLRYDQGAFRLRFPMVVAPRYVPGAVHAVSLGPAGWAVESTDRVPDAGRLNAPVLPPEAGKTNPVRLAVALAPGLPIGAIDSRYHAIRTTTDEAGRTLVTLADEVVAADRDFELVWRPDVGAAPAAALFAEEFGGEAYLLAMIVPPDPAEAANDPAPPREVIFVLDVSGSMGGQSIRQAKAALALAIDRLGGRDRFNLVVFNHEASALFASPRRADAEARRRALDFVAGLDADGGTEMAPALILALGGAPPAGFMRQVVFLTDGAVGNESELFDIIDRGLGNARLFTVGIGSAPNSYFMVKAAETGRGSYTHIGSVEEVNERMTRLFAKLERPVMVDLAAHWPAGSAPALSRATLPDLYAGEPVVFTARLTRLEGALTITGTRAGAPWQASLNLVEAAPAAGIAGLWANDRIDDLLHQAGVYLDPEAVRDEVVALALSHHLVTRYTSLVAVDVTPSRPDGTPLLAGKLPLNLPDGWDYEKVFGEPSPAARKARLEAASLDADTTFAAIGGAAGLALPQGATPAALNLLAGLALLAAGLVVLRRRRRA
jgi:Ca-activated chloride channel family protein